MPQWIAKVVAWVISHPEVIKAVADAATSRR